MSAQRCMGCHARGALSANWRIAWCLVELPGARGLFAATLCPSCWPRMSAEESFRERTETAILTTAREQFEEMGP
ncbi:hypothetical protein GCM10023089_32090 [Quisquiliibacterium transsilvanicum]